MSTTLLIAAGIGYLLGVLVGVWIAHGRWPRPLVEPDSRGTSESVSRPTQSRTAH
jgi:hypothetical protein